MKAAWNAQNSLFRVVSTNLPLCLQFHVKSSYFKKSRGLQILDHICAKVSYPNLNKRNQIKKNVTKNQEKPFGLSHSIFLVNTWRDLTLVVEVSRCPPYSPNTISVGQYTVDVKISADRSGQLIRPWKKRQRRQSQMKMLFSPRLFFPARYESRPTPWWK